MVTPVSSSPPHPSLMPPCPPRLFLSFSFSFRVLLVQHSCLWIALAVPNTNTHAGHPVVHTRRIAATHWTAERETICQSINFYRRSRRRGEESARGGTVGTRHRNGIESIYLCAGYRGKGLALALV